MCTDLLQTLCLLPEVFKQKFYMKFCGHPNPKPTLVVANSPKIILLQHPTMKLADLKCEKKTMLRGVRKTNGKPSYQGSKELKDTQFFGSKYRAIEQCIP